MAERMLGVRRDTIFAPASGVGRSAIAVVRISGPDCAEALQALSPGAIFPDRVATLRTLYDPETREPLDRALIVRFVAPRSFTGEEMAELHVTGGRAVLAGVMTALGKTPGLRPADPGEFAWRAFENGKLDLAEIEGLADLVDAETAVQRRQALRIAGGALSREADALRARLIRAMAVLESQIDFSDVEDAESLSLRDARLIATEASDRIRAILVSARSGERLRDGLSVVIAGPPNVGKSTLMNALSKREVSIVSATPGTTRDLIEVSLDLDGYPVTLIDTAGIRDTNDPIEREGVERARRRSAEADLTLWLTESESPIEHEPFGPSLRVITKQDQATQTNQAREGVPLRISAKTGDGLSELLGEITRFAAIQFAATSSTLITTERHRIAFTDAQAALARALDPDLEAVELVAEDLRLAARALDRIAGRIDVEDVLGDIFSRFCVGK